MLSRDDIQTRDRCDEKFTEPKHWIGNSRQKRFLEAYSERPTISYAARLSGVHRGTIYRWRADPAFAEAMNDAYERFYQANRIKILAEEAEYQRWAEQRERELRPMRLQYLERARAALAAKRRRR